MDGLTRPLSLLSVAGGGNKKRRFRASVSGTLVFIILFTQILPADSTGYYAGGHTASRTFVRPSADPVLEDSLMLDQLSDQLLQDSDAQNFYDQDAVPEEELLIDDLNAQLLAGVNVPAETPEIDMLTDETGNPLIPAAEAIVEPLWYHLTGEHAAEDELLIVDPVWEEYPEETMMTAGTAEENVAQVLIAEEETAQVQITEEEAVEEIAVEEMTEGEIAEEEILIGEIAVGETAEEEILIEKSRESTDLANVRSAYAEVMTQYLEDGEAASMEVTSQQKVAGWQTQPQPSLMTQINGTEGEVKFAAKTNGDTYVVGLTVADDGTVAVAVN